ncbi:LysM peptidoglycan-binding domain-containing protein [Desulfovibrio inopinatus]|uniref:LysM peptidoglycan-binding domain-containing protein n=1 Tax=Desulfovibrio inopinatus TaxID=102109 RepID=UPI0004020715|nr:LysM peptidoglycan-binding domain-containing protein [Desulfovibrio inopinatus]
MRKFTKFLIFFIAIVLSGCGKGYYADKENYDMQANLEPELWETNFLSVKRGRPLTEVERKALASKPTIPFNLDVTQTAQVERFLQYFAEDKRSTMERWLRRSEPYLPYVRAVLASYDLPPDLIVLPFIESGYNSSAYSRVGAGGMWQFMPLTARRFGLTVDWWVDERRNPYKSTVAAAQYLSKLHQMFGDWHLALAAYNCGEGRVSRAMTGSAQVDFFDLAAAKKLPRETRMYVPKFLAVLMIFQNLKALGFKPVNWNVGDIMKEVPVKGGTDLLAMAKACGMTWEQFSDANTAFRRQVSPPNREATVYVPKSKYQLAMAFSKDPSKYPPAGYTAYAVRSGESWWNIARQYGVPIDSLREFNPGLGGQLSAGTTVKVPGHSTQQESMIALSSIKKTRKHKVIASAACNYSKNSVRHKVKRGETLSAIAARYGVSQGSIMKANGLRSAKYVQAGKRLTIPGTNTHVASTSSKTSTRAKSVHKVKRGETLYAISQKYGVSSATIMRANNLSSPNSLRSGAKLVIPGKSGSATRLSTKDRKAFSYKVGSGETVWSIARKFQISPTALLSWNNLSRTTKLQIGQRLTIHK